MSCQELTESTASSCDSQLTNDDIRFLEACVECDDDALYDIIQDGLTVEEINERDRSGRVSVPISSTNYSCLFPYLNRECDN